MTEHIIEAYRVDIETRLRDAKIFGFFRVPEGYQVNVHEIHPGVIYQDANVKVTAFPTKHAMESYGYRFDTPDRSIVISGDTSPTDATIQACNGCDVLIHELEMSIKPATTSFGKSLEAFGARYHTNVDQLAELAKKAKPHLLVIYHAAVSLRPATAGPDSSSMSELFNAIAARYPGHVVVGQDLDVY
jgi:ribonuclease BN (tRNA processing enzyme)